MASKFVIKTSNYTGRPVTFYWQLLSSADEILMVSKTDFSLIKEAKQDIAKVKKAITRYTKVEVEE